MIPIRPSTWCFYSDAIDIVLLLVDGTVLALNQGHEAAKSHQEWVLLYCFFVIARA